MAQMRRTREGWHPARLIPAVGIRGQEEQEKRATSSLLAVMQRCRSSVTRCSGRSARRRGGSRRTPRSRSRTPPARRTSLTARSSSSAARPRGGASSRSRPGPRSFGSEQVNRYLDMGAREPASTRVLTISNQITGVADGLPGRGRRAQAPERLALPPLVVADHHRGDRPAPPSRRLGPRPGLDARRADRLPRRRAVGRERLPGHGRELGQGPQRRRRRDAPSLGHEVRDVAERWEQFVEYLCLGLGQDLGRDVRPVASAEADGRARASTATAAALAETGRLEAAIRVPDAVGPLTVQADLRTQAGHHERDGERPATAVRRRG